MRKKKRFVLERHMLNYVNPTLESRSFLAISLLFLVTVVFSSPAVLLLPNPGGAAPAEPPLVSCPTGGKLGAAPVLYPGGGNVGGWDLEADI